MHEWITQVLRERRELAGISLRDMEQATDVDRGNLSRFERGLSQVRGMDGLVAGYANALGVHPAVLWREALERWEHAEGVRPPDGRRRPRLRRSA